MRNWRDILGKQGLEFKCAYQSLKDPDFQPDALTALNNYFDKICVRKYKEEWVFNQIFKLKYTEKEYPKYCMASVNAARVTLSRVINNMDQIKEIKITKAFLIDLICDLKPFIQVVDYKQDMSWLLTNTNNSDAYFYFNFLTKLLYGKEYTITDDALF